MSQISFTISSEFKQKLEETAKQNEMSENAYISKCLNLFMIMDENMDENSKIIIHKPKNGDKDLEILYRDLENGSN